MASVQPLLTLIDIETLHATMAAEAIAAITSGKKAAESGEVSETEKSNVYGITLQV